MLFYLQMGWNIEGRISFSEVWDVEIKEALEGSQRPDGLEFQEFPHGKLAHDRVIQLIRRGRIHERNHAFLPGHFVHSDDLESDLRSRTLLEDCRTHFGAKEGAA